MKSNNTETLVVRSNGLDNESCFTIKANAKSFEILSSSLYSDKIRAVIRELACNAYDSHIEANKKDVPIEIKLPNYFNPTFYVKDWGTGLSHDQVMKLYTTYFESTKTSSNDYVGMLGLGSKSPFSLVSTFTVESRYNGIKRIYTCFKNEANLPSIVLMSESNTIEDNGLTISLAVNPEDFHKFETSAKKTLVFFDPIPNVVDGSDFSIPKPEYIVQGSNWNIRSNSTNYNAPGPHIIQGLIPYPITSSVIQSHPDLSQIAKTLLNINLDIHVNIGDVEIAASRESLSYDKRTITNVVNFLNKIADELVIYFQKQIDKCNSDWEVAVLTHQLRKLSNQLNAIVLVMKDNKQLSWNGGPIPTSVQVGNSSIKDTCLIEYKKWHTSVGLRIKNRWSPTNPTKEPLTITPDHHIQVVVDDQPRGNHRAYVQYANKFVHMDGRLIVLKPIAKNRYNQSEIDYFLSTMGNIQYKTISELKKICNIQDVNRGPRVTTPRAKKTKDTIAVWKSFPYYQNRRGYKTIKRVYSYQCWDFKELNSSLSGFYVPLHNHSIQLNDRTFNMFDELLELAQKANIFDATTNPVHGLTPQQIKLIQHDNNWVNLFDYIKEQVLLLDNTGQLTNALIFNGLRTSDWYIKRIEEFVTYWDKLQPLAETGKFKTFVQQIIDIREKGTTQISAEHIDSLFTYLNIPRDLSHEINKIEMEFRDKIVPRYTLLPILNIRYVSYAQLSNIINGYINLIDSKNSVDDTLEI
ncbi:MAG: ATP-binding protein [Nitrososphaeraceae archaeon]